MIRIIVSWSSLCHYHHCVMIIIVSCSSLSHDHHCVMIISVSCSAWWPNCNRRTPSQATADNKHDQNHYVMISMMIFIMSWSSLCHDQYDDLHYVMIIIVFWSAWWSNCDRRTPSQATAPISRGRKTPPGWRCELDNKVFQMRLNYVQWWSHPKTGTNRK